MITIERAAVLDAIHHTRIHLERADHAARVCLHADRSRQGTTKPWLQDLLTKESEEAGQHVTIEQDRAIDTITQLITQATGQEVTITQAQE